MKPEQTDIGKKRSRALKIALAVVVTIAQVLFTGAMLMAYQEMRHEGATYSQWYEGSIKGFYGSVVWFMAVTPLFAAAWRALICDLLGKEVRHLTAKMTKQRWGGVFLAFMFALIAVMLGHDNANKALELERAANSEALAWRFEQVGRYKVLMMLAAQGYAFALAGMIRGYIAESRSARQSARKEPSAKKARRKALRQQNAQEQKSRNP